MLISFLIIQRNHNFETFHNKKISEDCQKSVDYLNKRHLTILENLNENVNPWKNYCEMSQMEIKIWSVWLLGRQETLEKY